MEWITGGPQALAFTLLIAGALPTTLKFPSRGMSPTLSVPSGEIDSNRESRDKDLQLASSEFQLTNQICAQFTFKREKNYFNDSIFGSAFTDKKTTRK